MEVTNVKIIDMDIDLIQKNLKAAYEDVRAQIIEGSRSKNLKSKCRWAIFDGYSDDNSYRMRIPSTAMKKIHNISGSRDVWKNIFEEAE